MAENLKGNSKRLYMALSFIIRLFDYIFGLIRAQDIEYARFPVVECPYD